MNNYKTKTFDIDEVTPLTQREQVALKNELMAESGVCQICLNTLKNPVLDHQHATKNENIGENGAGLVRGVLCSQCNAFLGKIENNSKRFGIKDLPKFLINAAHYIEQPNLPFVHSTETRKLKEKLSKSTYNKFIALYCEKTKKDKEFALKKFKYSSVYNKSLIKLREFVKN